MSAERPSIYAKQEPDSPAERYARSVEGKEEKMKVNHAGRLALIAALLAACQVNVTETAPPEALPTDTAVVEATATEPAETATVEPDPTDAATATARSSRSAP